MLINNININNFNATLLSRDIQVANVTTFTDWLDNSTSPTKLKEEKFKFSPIEVKLLVEGNNEQEVLTNISNIIIKCKSGELKFTDMDYYYNVTVESYSNKKIIDKAYELEITFKSDYKYKLEVIETMSRIITKTINVPGNAETPCIVEITPGVDAIDLIINGLSEDPITIRNLKQNKKIIINESTVLQEGINKFEDTDLWEFPSLQPGANTITLSKNTMNMNIKYKGRWI